jgi:general secretion pathway protein A
VYAAYFGLTERPFALAPDPRYLFLSDGHREALAHLVYGLEGGGFVQLTGEVGTGKTTVSRALLDQLPPEVDVAMIFTPRLTAVELLAVICHELHLDIPAGTTSATRLVDALSRKLLDTHAKGRRTVVIIDEAQNLSMEVLEELRLLTNIETTRDKLLQVILIGQPELVDVMQRPELRQLAQRVTARYHLRPFGYAETTAYVQHRLEVAGQREPMFTRAAVWLVHRRSRGVPRLINNICDRALLGAFAKGKRRVTIGIVRRAAAEVLGPGADQYWLEAGIAATIVAVILAGTTMLNPNALEYVTSWWAKRIMPRANAIASTPTSAPVASPTPTPVATPAPAAAPVPSTTPVPAATPVPAVVLPKARPSLATLLDTRTKDRDAAFASLFALWGEDYAARRGEVGCDFARRAGLRCLVKTGTWKVLRRLDLPAMLTLVSPDGEPHYATMTALQSDTATLDVAGETVTIPLTEIERIWDGAFVALWRTPGLATTDLRPGMSSRDVAWLRQQLAEGGATPERLTVYDDELKQRVVAFQRANGLTPDGIVGDETLVRIAAMATDARMPSLSKARP